MGIRLRILVVEDSPTVKAALVDMLGHSGVQRSDIAMASDGAEALDVFRIFQPDVVFMDIEMPRLDGVQATTLMLTENPRVKIIVASGVDRSDPRIRFLIMNGVFEVLEKPIRFERVQRALKLVESETMGYRRIK